VEPLPWLGCQAEGQRAKVGLIGCDAVKARMRSAAVVQQGLRTPTGPFSENCMHVNQFFYGFVLYVFVFLCLLLGLACTLWSLFMHDYEDITDPQELLERTIEEDLCEEAFFDILITNMNVRRQGGE
jgi:hypothetical protein